MYFYWRIMEELKYLGEILVFHDPNFKREFRKWMKRNQGGLAFSVMEGGWETLDVFDPFGIGPSLN